MSQYDFIDLGEGIDHLIDVLIEHSEKLDDARAVGIDPVVVCRIATGIGDIARAICSLINPVSENGCNERKPE